MSITHFINPNVIGIDGLDAKVEAAVDTLPISVHAVYKCDAPIQIKCVNITPNESDASFKLKDLDDNDLTRDDIITIFNDALPNMRHVEVSGNIVTESSLLGSNLTVKNRHLSNLLYPSNSNDIDGNFKLRKEIFKTLSSYLTNHVSLSLTDSIVDVSGESLQQLNSAEHIANELVRFETVQLDASGNDTKSYLNSFLDINNSVEVFGDSTISKIVFIVSSEVNVAADKSIATGLNVKSLSSVNNIGYRNSFNDELGDPLLPTTGSLNGKWYSALCFDIATQTTSVNVSSGPKFNFAASLYNPSTDALIYDNSTRTNLNGQIVLDDNFTTSLEVVKVVAKNIDGSGYDTITLEKNMDLEITSYIEPQSTKKTFMCTTLTSMLVNIVENEGVTIDSSFLANQKTELESKLSSNPNFSLDINPYSSSTSDHLAKEVSKTILEIETLQESMTKIIGESSVESRDIIQKKVLKGISKVFKQSTSQIDLNNITDLDKIIEESVKENLGQATDTTNYKTDNRSALASMTNQIKTASESDGSLVEILTEMHKKKKQISTALETNNVSSIDETIIDNQTVAIETAVIHTDGSTDSSSGSQTTSNVTPIPGKSHMVYEFTNTDTTSTVNTSYNYTRSSTTSAPIMYYSPSNEEPIWKLDNITDGTSVDGSGKNLTGLIDGNTYRVTVYLTDHASGGDGGFNTSYSGNQFLSGGDKMNYNQTVVIKDFGTMPLEGQYIFQLYAGTFDSNIGVPVINALNNNTGSEMLNSIFKPRSSPSAIPRIDEWDISKLKTLRYAFRVVNYETMNLSTWNLSNVTSMHGLFSGNNVSETFNPIGVSNWNVSGVKDFQECFNGSELVGVDNLRVDATSWNVTSATNLQNMFGNCYNFNQDIGSWNVNNVVFFNNMFNCTVQHGNFNQDLDTWNVSSGTHFETMFRNQINFNGSTANWDFTGVKSSFGSTMNSMFVNSNNFNGNVAGWKLPAQVISVFGNCDSFTGIGTETWDLTNVNTLQNVFMDSAFNNDISTWNVAGVTSMHGLFANCSEFNQDISSWNVQNVTTFRTTFKGASKFNQDISNWDPISATNLSNMFENAIVFDSNMDTFIATAESNNTVNKTDMFLGATAYNS